MKKRSSITTHVLDVSSGKPAAHINCRLESFESDWVSVGQALTDKDGRIEDFGSFDLNAGIYRLSFDTDEYFSTRKVASFYPSVNIIFEVVGTEEHYHVPLLLSPYGYSTYRGS